MTRIFLLMVTVIALCAASTSTDVVCDQFYVSPIGIDSGNCSSASAPCLTISYTTQQALDSNAGNAVQYINLSAGGWNESVNVEGTSRNSANSSHNDQLVYDGDGAANTMWNGGTTQCGVLIANKGANVGVENMTMEAEGNSCQSIVYAQLGGLAQIMGGMQFGPSYGSALFCEDAGSQIEVWGSFTMIGPTYTGHALATATTACSVEFNPTGNAITFAAPITYSIGFFDAEYNGVVYDDSPGFMGTNPSGPRFNATVNASIYTNGYGCGNLPGTLQGTTSLNGICN